MCRVCVALGSLAARGAPVLLRDSLPAAARGASVQALRQLGCHAKGLHTRAPLSPSAAHALRNWPASSAWATLRGFACRTKFDAPPPKMVSELPALLASSSSVPLSKFLTAPCAQVLVEYDPAEVDSFIALADAIEVGRVNAHGGAPLWACAPRGPLAKLN
jgi:hypothetical protein